MAGIIECIAQTGQTLYSVIHNSSGQLWNTGGVAFENYNSAHWSNYVTSLTEQSPTGYYSAVFPIAIPVGKYTEVYYQGSGLVTDAVIGNSEMYWDGTSEEQGVGAILASLVLAELSGIPGAAPTLSQAIMLLYMSIRNEHSATATQEFVKNNVGGTIGTSALSDDGVTTTKGKFS